MRDETQYPSACSQHFQPMQRNRLGIERFEFDFGCRALGAFAPAVNARVGFFAHAAAGWPQEVARVIERSRLASCWPRKRFDGVAAQSGLPISLEESRGGEYAAPSDLAH